MKKSAMLKMVAMASSSAPSKPSKRSRKPLFAVIVIILVVVVAVGVYIGTRNGANSPSATPTPTPSTSTTATPTTIGIGANIAGASSLQFTVSVTNSSGASLGSYTYYAKNIGTSNAMIRIESTDSSGSNFVYIVNGALQQAWAESNGQWTDVSTAYSSQYSTWNTAFTGYSNSLVNWSGTGDWTYADPNGDTVRISNVSVNPSLADSLFQHS